MRTTCSRCGAAITHVAQDSCLLCGQPLLEPGAFIQSVGPIPWASAGSLGIIRSLVSTVMESLFSPLSFYSKLSSPYDSKMPFVYALILGSIGSVFGFFWNFLFLSWLASYVPMLEEFSDAMPSSGSNLIATPLLIAIKVLVVTVYIHALIALTNSKRQGIKSTFAVVCYAESAAVFNFIPVVGSFVSVIWALWIVTIGLNRVHRMSVAKAVIIILLPLLAITIVGILAVAAIVGVGAFVSGFL